MDSKTSITHCLGDKKSWVTSTLLKKELRPTKAEIEELWLLKPADKGIIMIAGKSIRTPRYSQTYSDEGKPYIFSGTEHPALPIPPLLQRYLAYANEECASILKKHYSDRKFNMVFVNWYPDGHHYIGYHSDDEKQLFKNAKGETLVFSISFGQERKFLVKSKEKKRVKEKTLSLALPNYGVVLMGGLCQTNYKHSVPKTEIKGVGRRLNLTFRIFK